MTLHPTRTTLRLALLLATASISLAAHAQQPQPESQPAPVLIATESSSTLPDAPSASASPLHAAVASAFDTPTTTLAPRYAKYIAPGQTAQPITAGDKVIIGFRDLATIPTFLSFITAAGYNQLVNGQPNYGTDRGAFGQKLGAAAIRGTSQGLFTDTVFSPLLHMDPRYYVMGPGHNVLHRAFYAATRVVVSRTDSGRTTINAPLLLGYAAASALTTTYYPQVNRNFKDVAEGYGGSIGGSAFGFAVSEFFASLLHIVHNNN